MKHLRQFMHKEVRVILAHTFWRLWSGGLM